MSAIGKLLTYLNVFFGVSLMTWAVSTYANRVDYLDRKGDAGAVEGQITGLKKELDRLSKSIADADAIYGARAARVAATEATRDYRQAKLRVRVEQARGTGAARTAQFRVQLPDPRNRPGEPEYTDVEREGPVVPDANGQPLRGLRTLQDELEKDARDAVFLVEGRRKVTPQQLNDLAGISDQDFDGLIGDLGIADLRTVHDRLSDVIASTDVATLKQKDVFANLREEASFLADKRVNWSAELRTLRVRQQQLEAEIRRLGGTPAGG